MRITTIGSIALLTVSSAALAQMTTTKPHMMHNNMASMNSTAPMNSTMPTNTQDEPMMNDTSTPDAMTPNSTMTPK